MRTFLRKLFGDIIGLVFFLSAVTKLMDPVGTGLIVDAYLLNLHLDFFRPFATAIGFILSMTEAVVSVGLLTGTFRQFFALASTAMILFFTAISVWLVVADPDMDCGCFGEAIPLTHWQTLFKNIALCLFCIPAFVPFTRLGYARTHRYVAFYLGVAIMLCYGVFFLIYNPLMEWSEMRPSHTIVPEGEITDERWEYPILPIWDENGVDCSYLAMEGDVALITVYDAAGLDVSDRTRIAGMAQDAVNAGYNAVLLSAGQIEVPGLDTYFADYRKVITMNRSNGGVSFIHDGYIIKKASFNNYPSFEQLDELYNKDAVEAYISSATHRSIALQAFALVFLAVIILV